MTVHISFKTDNAAFETDRQGEIARVLRDVADRIQFGDSGGIIRDANGNTIGEYSGATHEPAPQIEFYLVRDRTKFNGMREFKADLADGEKLRLDCDYTGGKYYLQKGKSGYLESYPSEAKAREAAKRMYGVG